MKKLLIDFILIIFFSSILFAQDGVHEHDGFFLRMLYGVGYAKMIEKNVLGSDMTFSGVCNASRIQIGGTISDNLILYGESGIVMQLDPSVEWNGNTISNQDVSIYVADFGGGITYYFMPSNIYLSFSLLLSTSSSGYDKIVGKEKGWFDLGYGDSSELGFGLNAMVGKEWWVGEQWALGVAVYGYYSTMKDKATTEGIDYEYDINNFSIGVMFSATYN